MKKVNVIALSFLTTLLTAGIANAETTIVDGGTVHFKGKIITAACAVSVNSADKIVQLGQYKTTAFDNVGDVSTKIPFAIDLNDCDIEVAKLASVAFNGQRDADDLSLLAVNGGGDNSIGAKGVGIEILDSLSNALTPDGKTYSSAQQLINGNNSIPFSARYKSTLADVKAGLANADATFTMKYE